MVQRGRVELEELDVRHRHPGAQRHGHPVTGGFGRVGRHRVELPRTSRGQHHLGGPDLLHGALGVEGHHAHTPAALDDQVEREPLLEHRRRAAPHGGDQGPLHLGPGGGSPGVQDPGGGMAAFPGQGEITAGFAVEHRAEADQLVDATGPLVHEHPHGVDVTQPGPGCQGVGQMEVGGVLVAAHRGGDAPLGPARRRLGQVGFGEHAHPEARRRGQSDNGGQARHPGAEDEDVELHRGRPRGRAGRGPQPVTAGRQRVVEPLHRQVHHGIGRVHVDDGGLEAHQLRRLVVGVGDDDHLVPPVHEPGRGAVETHLAGTAEDGVGLEPRAVVDVEHGDLFVLEDVGERHELGIEADGSDVVEVGVGHRGPMDLGLHHAPPHPQRSSPVCASTRPCPSPTSNGARQAPSLSMSRIAPTCAATSRRTSPSTCAGHCKVSGSTTTA